MTAEEARSAPLTPAELADEKIMIALVLKRAREKLEERLS